MITLYNVVSSDGFIARKGGSEDFIPDESWPKTLEFFKQFGMLVMGRNTYNAIQEYPEELLKPFEELPIAKIVITSNQNFLPRAGYETANSPEEAFRMGDNIVVSSSPTLNNYLLEHNLVDKIVLRKVLGEIGDGIKPYNSELTKLVPNYIGNNELLVTKVFDAPCELVWKAWTTPELIARWFAPGIVMDVRELDVRPGGHFRFADPADPTQGEYTGTYVIVEPLKELSFQVVDYSETTDPAGVTAGFKVEFETVGEQTKMTLTAIPPENSYDERTFNAWTGCFERLAEVIK